MKSLISHLVSTLSSGKGGPTRIERHSIDAGKETREKKKAKKKDKTRNENSAPRSSLSSNKTSDTLDAHQSETVKEVALMERGWRSITKRSRRLPHQPSLLLLRITDANPR